MNTPMPRGIPKGYLNSADSTLAGGAVKVPTDAMVKAYVDPELAKIGYALQFGGIRGTIDDLQTLFVGSNFNLGSMQATSGISKIKIVKAGIITDCVVSFYTGSTPTSETSSVYLRLNNTTDYLVASDVALNTGSFEITKTGLSITVVAGDYVEIKWVNPTYVTNPSTVYLYGNVWVSQ